MLAFLRHLALQLVDPRGRSNRTDLLHVAIAMFAMQGLMLIVLWHVEEESGRVSALPGNLAVLYMAACAATRRLHDLGRSAWWMPIAAATWAAAGFAATLVLVLILGPSRMQPGLPAFWLVFLGLMLPPLLAALWLHMAEGEPSPNRFGPVPGDDTRFEGNARAALPPVAATAQPRRQPRRFAAHA